MSDVTEGVPPQEPDPASTPEPAAHEPANGGAARALTLHVLHMLETRMDAAGIAINSEVNSFTSRLQLKLVAGGALFMAVWGGIVLIAIALPETWRIPVLAGVIACFVLAALWALAAAKRKADAHDVGSMHWFMEGLRRDLEVLSRTLGTRGPHAASPQSTGAPHE